MFNLINVSFYYKIKNGEDQFTMILGSYYGDEVVEKNLYFEVRYEKRCIGLIFKNSNIIIKKDSEVIYE